MTLRLFLLFPLALLLHLTTVAQCVAIDVFAQSPYTTCSTEEIFLPVSVSFVDSSATDNVVAYFLRDTNTFDPQAPDPVATFFTNETTLPAGIIAGQSYYLFVAAGKDDGNGLPDPNNPDCYEFTQNGLEIIFSPALSIDVPADGFVIPCNDNSTPVTVALQGGIPPYVYLWSSGETTATINVNFPGAYTVTVTDALGCSLAQVIYVNVDINRPLTVDSTVNISCENPLGAIYGSWDGDYDLAYFFVGQGDVTFPTDSTFIYTTTFPEPNGIIEWGYGNSPNQVCYDSLTPFSILQTSDGCAFIEGNVYRDTDTDCTLGGGDTPLEGRLVQLTGSVTRYAYSDASGDYSLLALPDESATLEIVSDHLLFENCNQPVIITTPAVGNTLIQNLGQQTVADCPLLTVEVSTSPMRRCFNMGIFVSYCNHGTLFADSAYVLLDIDPLLTIQLDSLNNVTLEPDGRYRVEVGDLAEGECGTLYLPAVLSCDAVLGQTICLEAEILPEFDCLPIENYNGAIVSVSGACDNGVNRFVIENTGAAAMQMPSSFIVIEDGVVLLQNPTPFDLNPGESIDVTYPGNGSTYRLEAEQVPEFPDNTSMPSATIEGCAANADSSFSTGFFLQFGLDDFYPSVDVECREVIGSFDPNDKQAFPRGYAAAHYIENETPLEYHIRFQNTGTDTAFTVVVEDALDPALDVSTFRPLSASHPYGVDFGTNDTVRFVFNDILLPDSFVNEPLSHGYIRFAIQLDADLPLETVVKNKASIYFDFNEPIITNEVFHTVGREFLTVSTYTAPASGLTVAAFPNPASAAWHLRITGLADRTPYTVVLTDVSGRPVRRTADTGTQTQLDVSDLPSGLYFYQVHGQNGLLASGKLIRQ